MFQSVVAREIVLVILLAVTMASCGDRHMANFDARQQDIP
jgi:hypothetical protein